MVMRPSDPPTLTKNCQRSFVRAFPAGDASTRGMTPCTRWLSVVAVFAASAFAQTPPPGNPNDWSAPPMTGAPVAKPAPAVNPDAVGVGIQFHGEVSGGTSGFGGAASFGIGFNRVAILFTPTLSLAANNVSLFVTTLDLSVRIYLRQRTAKARLQVTASPWIVFEDGVEGHRVEQLLVIVGHCYWPFCVDSSVPIMPQSIRRTF